MKNAFYLHQVFRDGKDVGGSHWDMNVHECIALRDDAVRETIGKGGKVLLSSTNGPVIVEKDGDLHLFTWGYVAPGYEKAETFREKVIVVLEQIGWGWSHVRCVIVGWFGLVWYAGEKWPRRKRGCH